MLGCIGTKSVNPSPHSRLHIQDTAVSLLPSITRLYVDMKIYHEPIKKQVRYLSILYSVENERCAFLCKSDAKQWWSTMAWNVCALVNHQTLATMAPSAGQQRTDLYTPSTNGVKSRGFQFHQERSFYCRPAVVVLAWPQTECVLRTRASALVVFRAPSPESQPAPRWGVLGRAPAKNNRPEIEKQQWEDCGMLLERN